MGTLELIYNESLDVVVGTGGAGANSTEEDPTLRYPTSPAVNGAPNNNAAISGKSGSDSSLDVIVAR